MSPRDKLMGVFLIDIKLELQGWITPVLFLYLVLLLFNILMLC